MSRKCFSNVSRSVAPQIEPPAATKVSVIMCVYNAAATVARAIERVLARAAEEVELIVVNDGSTDSTRSVLKDYRGRITVIDQASDQCRERAVSSFCRCRRYVAPRQLAETCAALDHNPESVLAFGDLMMTDDGERLANRERRG